MVQGSFCVQGLATPYATQPDKARRRRIFSYVCTRKHTSDRILYVQAAKVILYCKIKTLVNKLQVKYDLLLNPSLPISLICLLC